VTLAPGGGALVKLAVAEGDAWVACALSHAFRVEPEGVGPARVVAAPDRDQVGLLIDLSRTLPEPFVVLYVLLSMRTLRPPGRYQSSRPLVRSQLEAFLSRHRAFLEQDGRHHLWIGSAAEPSTLVYDQHQVLELYGRLDAYLPVLRAAGMDEGPVVIPERHRHECHAAFDAEEHALLSEQAWGWNPLEPEDEELDDS
jgi:hypothetical protein